MRILLTNDDGIHAPGLTVLEGIAAELSDDLWVVAPAEEQSGAGHSLSLSRPVRVRRHGERRWSVAGTPTDAVMMALGQLIDGPPPDLILSGVNRGANLGEDVTYSGTVAAAMEGALAGVPSIALSQVYARQGMGDSVPFAVARHWGATVLRALLTVPPAPRTLVNVNFPVGEPDAVTGVRVVAQGFHDMGRTRIVENTDPRGYRYYWFALGGEKGTPDHSTDLEAVADGAIAVTPLQLDLTHHESLEPLAAALAPLADGPDLP